jgi:hypothetical protein
MKEERENTQRRIRCVTSSIGKSKNNKNVVSIFAEYQWKKPLWNFPLDGCGLIHSLPKNTCTSSHTAGGNTLYFIFLPKSSLVFFLLRTVSQINVLMLERTSAFRFLLVGSTHLDGNQCSGNFHNHNSLINIIPQVHNFNSFNFSLRVARRLGLESSQKFSCYSFLTYSIQSLPFNQ